jgi:hypothetical protein
MCLALEWCSWITHDLESLKVISGHATSTTRTKQTKVNQSELLEWEQQSVLETLIQRVPSGSAFPTFHRSDSDSCCCDAWFWDGPPRGEGLGFECSLLGELMGSCSRTDYENERSAFQDKVTKNPVEMIETPLFWPRIQSKNPLAVMENLRSFWQWCKIPSPYFFSSPVESISHNICSQYRGSLLNSTKPKVAGFRYVVFLIKFPIEWMNSFKLSILEFHHLCLNVRIRIIKSFLNSWKCLWNCLDQHRQSISHILVLTGAPSVGVALSLSENVGKHHRSSKLRILLALFNFFIQKMSLISLLL